MHLYKIIPLSFLLLLFSCNKIEKQYAESHINSGDDLQNYILDGWNTWNSCNLTEQVLLPEGLVIRMSFKPMNQSYHDTFYQSFIDEEDDQLSDDKIEILEHTINGDYTEIIYHYKGLKARIQSSTRREDIFILYTPLELPENPPLLVIESGILWDSEGTIKKKDDFFQAEFGARTITISTTGVDSLIPLPLISKYIILPSDESTGIYTGKKRSLEYIVDVLNKREKRVANDASLYGEYAGLFNEFSSFLSWNTIYDPFNYQAIAPFERKLFQDWNSWLYRGQDSYFKALAFALFNKYHAYSNLLAANAKIDKNGFIPYYYGSNDHDNSIDQSAPPIGSIITRLIYEKYKEPWILEEVYDKLLSWNRWWEENSDNDGYLSWGAWPTGKHDTIKKVIPDLIHSGLENNLIYENADFNQQKGLYDIGSIGLMSLYIADCKNLAEIATIIGKTEDTTELMNRSEKYSEKLRSMWDNDAGVYRDFLISSNKPSGYLSPSIFLPMLAEVPTQKQAEILIQNYFMSKDEFFDNRMLPDISQSSMKINDEDLKAIVISPELNFLVYLALDNYNLPEAKKILAEKSLWLLNGNEGRGGTTVHFNDHLRFYSDRLLLNLIVFMEEGYWDIQ